MELVRTSVQGSLQQLALSLINIDLMQCHLISTSEIFINLRHV